MSSFGLLRRVALVRTDIFLCSVRRLLDTANIVPSSPILLTLMSSVALVRTDIFLCSVRWLLDTASIVPSSPILLTLMM
jgi:hypothetical protein